MKARFKIGDAIMADGKAILVKVVKKDFSNGEISYRLVDGTLIAESDILSESIDISTKAQGAGAELAEIYTTVVGKPVPKNKKNNKEWILAKIKEHKDANDALLVEKIQEMSVKEVMVVIMENNLDIDTEDYQDLEELREAVTDEVLA